MAKRHDGAISMVEDASSRFRNRQSSPKMTDGSGTGARGVQEAAVCPRGEAAATDLRRDASGAMPRDIPPHR